MTWPTLTQMDLGANVTVSWIQRGKRKTISGTVVNGDKSLTYGLWIKEN